MKIAIIGRTEILYDTAVLLREAGHEIVCVLTAKEAPEYTRKARDFQALAEAWKIPFAQGRGIFEFTDFLRDARADIGVSINYTGIVPQTVTDLFQFGVLNAHGGDLPRYRGNACQAWAILNGEERIGLCIHKMIGGELDSGDIIAREYLDIDDNTKVTKCWEWMTDRVPPLFLEAVDKLQQDSGFVLEQQSTDPEEALRCYPRKPEDGRIDWSQGNLAILRLINASNKPYAGAFCEFESEKMIIWDAELVDDQENFYAVPGQVTLVGESFVEVACKQGKLRLKEVEIKGKLGTPDRWLKSIRKRLQ
jgi:methionyl-tRNA formyltransferase